MTARVLERVVHRRLVALSAVDVLAQALGTAGRFPPPIGDLRCEVVEVTGPQPRRIDPPWKVSFVRTGAGFLLLDGTYETASERGRAWPLGAGTYRARLRGDCYRDAEFTLAWPPADDQLRVPLDAQDRPDSVRLMPGPGYPVPAMTAGQLQLGPTLLRGTAVAASGEPLPDLAVEVVNLPFLQPNGLPNLDSWPFLASSTDGRGDWVIVLPDRRYIDAAAVIPPGAPLVKDVTLRAHYPARTVTRVEAVVLGGEHSVRNTALRGRVTDASGRPVAGARLSSSATPATSISRGDGAWFLYFDLDQPGVPGVTVTATAPGGASASTSTAVVAHSTVVVPTIRFT